MPKMTRQDQTEVATEKDELSHYYYYYYSSSVHTMLGSTVCLTLIYHGGSQSLFDTYYITFVLLNHLYLILSKFLPKFHI